MGERRGARVTKEELKRQVQEVIDKSAERIIGVGEEIRRRPELGFKETETARIVCQAFRALGLEPKAGLALTGVRAEENGNGRSGPTLALIGELDALVVDGHPSADPATKACPG